MSPRSLRFADQLDEDVDSARSESEAASLPPMTPRTLSLYKIQHAQLACDPQAPPPLTIIEQDRLRAQHKRDELLADRRGYWNARWSDLQQSLAARLAAAEDASQDRCEAEVRCTAERDAFHARMASLSAVRHEQHRMRAVENAARKAECKALNVESQKQHVLAHYCLDELLVPFHARLRSQFQREVVAELEEREMQLRESARATQRMEGEVARRAAIEQRMEREAAHKRQAAHQQMAQQQAQSAAQLAEQARVLQARTSTAGRRRR